MTGNDNVAPLPFLISFPRDDGECQGTPHGGTAEGRGAFRRDGIHGSSFQSRCELRPVLRWSQRLRRGYFSGLRIFLPAWEMISPMSTWSASPMRRRVSSVGFQGVVSSVLMSDWLKPVFSASELPETPWRLRSATSKRTTSALIWSRKFSLATLFVYRKSSLTAHILIMILSGNIWTHRSREPRKRDVMCENLRL